MSLTFNPDVATIFQPNNYGCAVATTAFCLDSIGIDVTYMEMDAIMVPGIVSREVGLRDGSGAGIVNFLTDDYGLQAHNQRSISFGEVAALAGQQPIGIGGHSWGGVGHWVSVRGLTDDGRLRLANSAGTGPTFGQQTLDEAGFDARGPFFIDDIAGKGNGQVMPRFLIVDTDGEGVRLRDAPRLSGARLGAVPEGGVVRAVELDGYSWRDVLDEASAGGWAADEFLAAEAGGFRVLGPQNPGLRAEPSSGAALIRELESGARLRSAVMDGEAFRLVRSPNGTVGWVRAQYLRRL